MEEWDNAWSKMEKTRGQWKRLCWIFGALFEALSSFIAPMAFAKFPSPSLFGLYPRKTLHV